MPFARISLLTAYDWIEQQLAAGQPSPTDAQICERLGFDAPEHARALLADLADAGRITIHGFGVDRTITLGRAKRQPSIAGRVAPSVKRPDPVLDRGLAKIAAIVARGRTSAPKGEATPITKQPPAEKEETIMPTPSPTADSRTISVPAKGTVLAAIEKRAAADNLPLGQATSAIVADWSASPVSTSIATPTPATIDDLCEQLRELFYSRDEATIAAAVARAEAAEGQLATLRTQIGQLLGGAA